MVGDDVLVAELEEAYGSAPFPVEKKVEFANAPIGETMERGHRDLSIRQVAGWKPMFWILATPRALDSSGSGKIRSKMSGS